MLHWWLIGETKYKNEICAPHFFPERIKSRFTLRFSFSSGHFVGTVGIEITEVFYRKITFVDHKLLCRKNLILRSRIDGRLNGDTYDRPLMNRFADKNTSCLQFLL